MSQLKFSLKISNNILIGGSGPPGPTPWLRSCLRPQKMFPDRKKIRQVMPVLPSHAGIMPLTEKNLLSPAF